MKTFLFILFSSLIIIGSGFVLNINKHYTNIASNIFNLNNNIKYNQDIFKTVKYYNQNRSICYSFNHKNNMTFLMKDKTNYAISFTVFKYKYLIFLKLLPIAYNHTEVNIDIRQSHQNYKYKINFNHYNRINNIIYRYIYNNVIIKESEELSIDLFKYFNSY
jgi:hypothetical protein